MMAWLATFQRCPGVCAPGWRSLHLPRRSLRARPCSPIPIPASGLPQPQHPRARTYPRGRRPSAAGARVTRRAAAPAGWPPAARTRWRRCARRCHTRRAPSGSGTRPGRTPGSPRRARPGAGRTARPRRRRTPGSSCRGRAHSRRGSAGSGSGTRRSARGRAPSPRPPGAPGPAPEWPARPGAAPAPAWRGGRAPGACGGGGAGPGRAATCASVAQAHGCWDGRGMTAARGGRGRRSCCCCLGSSRGWRAPGRGSDAFKGEAGSRPLWKGRPGPPPRP